MTCIHKIIIGIALQALLFSAAQVFAFEISGSRWLSPEAEYYVDMDGTAASGISWNTAFIAAMNDWSEATSFNFIARREKRNPCINDGFNGVDFSGDFCGSAFGKNTLAVTVRRFDFTVLGEATLREADIVINQTKEFDVYDGNLDQFGRQGLDFRRVVLHELGHAIGLDHETTTNAIMAPDIGNLDRLQADDIAGAEKLYDGTINCVVQELVFGVINDALDANDCTVSELLPGSSDDSAIDLYRFELSSTATISLSMSSPTLDSVLLVADSNFQILGFDNKSSNDCDSSLIQFLQPGSYFLMANTFDEPVKAACGTFGDYRIDASFRSSGRNPLGSATSLGGAVTNASFSGGITADNGRSFGNKFSADASLDISGQITIDPQHRGQPGFLVVAAITGQQILLLNESGQFVDSAANPGVLTRAANKILAATENITVAENLVPASLGVSEIVVDFYFGYGLSSNPDELYFHQAPLNLTVAP